MTELGFGETAAVVLLGFDYDELYNLAADPFEMNNLAQNPAHADRIQAMTRQMWSVAVESGNHSLANTHDPPLRIAAAGPAHSLATFERQNLLIPA